MLVIAGPIFVYNTGRNEQKWPSCFLTGTRLCRVHFIEILFVFLLVYDPTACVCSTAKARLNNSEHPLVADLSLISMVFV
jgi:hypothetical protein